MGFRFSYFKDESYQRWIPFVVGIIVFGVYCQTLGFDFIEWDDRYGILENTALRKFDLWGLFSTRTNDLYHPLTMLTFAIEHHLVGLKPFLFHLDNLLLHEINTVLLYFIFVWHFKVKPISAGVGALIFGVHPMSVESVTWITERKDLLTALFFFSSFHCYVKRSNVKSLLLFFLGLLVKPMIVTFPVVAIAYDFYSGRKQNWRTALEKVPFFLLSLLSVLVTLGYLFPFPDTPPPLPLWDRFDNTINSLFFYLSRFLFPRNLMPFYEGSWSRVEGLDFVIGTSLIALFSIAYWLLPKIRRDLSFGLAFFLITISIVLQFFPFGPTTFQNHYLYISGIGLIFISVKLGEALYGASSSSWRRLIPLGAGVILLSFAGMTWQENQTWRNQETLSLSVLKINPESPRALAQLGQTYLKDKQFGKALPYFEQVLRTGLAKEATYLSIGTCYSGLGRHQEALETFETARRLFPQDVIPLNDLGFEYLVLKSYDKAEALFQQVIRIDPKFAMAHKNLGQLYLIQNKLPQAKESYRTALALDPFLELVPQEIVFVTTPTAKP